MALACAIGVGLARAGAAEPTAEPTGLEIAKRSDQARRSKTEHSVMTMILENSRGQQRLRTVEGYGHELTDSEERRFARFLKPSDVKDTTLLTYDYSEKDDDIWLYLPALKKTKRILSSNKTDYFMGSDFTYWDMENLDFVNWEYKLLGSETVSSVDCWIVEALPLNDKEREESGYLKTVSWIAKTDDIPRKIEFHDRKERLAKVLVFTDIRPTTAGDSRLRAHTMTMDNLLTEHKTVLKMDVLELDVAVDDEVFSERNMVK
jgi:hypothetical protein